MRILFLIKVTVNLKMLQHGINQKNQNIEMFSVIYREHFNYKNYFEIYNIEV